MQNSDEKRRNNRQSHKKEWEKANYTQINFNVRKDKQYKERLKLLSIGTNKSQNQLLIEAIEDLFVKYDKPLNEQQTNK